MADIEVRKVLFSDAVIRELFTRDHNGNRLSVEWGQPDSDGFYNPTITRHDDGFVSDPELFHGLRHLAAICDAYDAKDEADVRTQIHMASAWLLAFSGAVTPTIDRPDTGRVIEDADGEHPDDARYEAMRDNERMEETQ